MNKNYPVNKTILQVVEKSRRRKIEVKTDKKVSRLEKLYSNVSHDRILPTGKRIGILKDINKAVITTVTGNNMGV